MKKKGYWLVIGLVALITATAAPVEAQKNCRKGIPCGNTCISASKVCRIGSATARSAGEQPTPPPARPSAAPASLAPTPQTPAPSRPEVESPTSTAADYPWIGSFADGIYFRADCSAALDLAPTNRRYFASEAVAEGAGYRRSRVSGC
jgi:hypothetical protein